MGTIIRRRKRCIIRPRAHLPSRLVVDLFAGAGGWDVAAAALGLHVVGIENDPAALKTRRAVGLHTMAGSVLDYSPCDFSAIWGLIASPPCPTFSTAGKGTGRRDLDVPAGPPPIAVVSCADLTSRQER